MFHEHLRTVRVRPAVANVVDHSPADVARSLGPNLTRARFIQALETQSFDTGMGVTLRWPHGDHGQEPYSFNHEYMYQWTQGDADGGFGLKRLLPDPVNA